MKTRLYYGIVFIFTGILIWSCGTSRLSHNYILRAAEDAPEAFVPSPGISFDSLKCKRPLIDPRDSTVITLIVDASGKGNYKVPEGKYGVKRGELLRVRCKDGRVLGIVVE